MIESLEFDVSNTDKLPQMDMSFSGGKGYDAVNELMRAIILRAIEDYSSHGELRDEAIRYFYGDDDDDADDQDDEYIFSFASICRHLGLDPEKTRYSIMNAVKKISTRRRAA